MLTVCHVKRLVDILYTGQAGNSTVTARMLGLIWLPTPGEHGQSPTLVARLMEYNVKLPFTSGA